MWKMIKLKKKKKKSNSSYHILSSFGKAVKHKLAIILITDLTPVAFLSADLIKQC